MNPNNYASLEASKQLVEAGIEMETEAAWCPFGRNGEYKLLPIEYFPPTEVSKDVRIPAPCMTEVWMELPEASAYLHTNKETEVWLEDEEDIIPKSNSFADTNPTDSLIYLLIWVRKEASHEFREFQERDQ